MRKIKTIEQVDIVKTNEPWANAPKATEQNKIATSKRMFSLIIFTCSWFFVSPDAPDFEGADPDFEGGAGYY